MRRAATVIVLAGTIAAGGYAPRAAAQEDGSMRQRLEEAIARFFGQDELRIEIETPIPRANKPVLELVPGSETRVGARKARLALLDLHSELTDILGESPELEGRMKIKARWNHVLGLNSALDIHYLVVSGRRNEDGRPGRDAEMELTGGDVGSNVGLAMAGAGGGSIPEGSDVTGGTAHIQLENDQLVAIALGGYGGLVYTGPGANGGRGIVTAGSNIDTDADYIQDCAAWAGGGAGWDAGFLDPLEPFPGGGGGAGLISLGFDSRGLALGGDGGNGSTGVMQALDRIGPPTSRMIEAGVGGVGGLAEVITLGREAWLHGRSVVVGGDGGRGGFGPKGTATSKGWLGGQGGAAGPAIAGSYHHRRDHSIADQDFSIHGGNGGAGGRGGDGCPPGGGGLGGKPGLGGYVQFLVDGPLLSYASRWSGSAGAEGGPGDSLCE